MIWSFPGPRSDSNEQGPARRPHVGLRRAAARSLLLCLPHRARAEGSTARNQQRYSIAAFINRALGLELTSNAGDSVAC